MPRLIYHLLGVPPHKVDNIEQIVEAMTQSMWEFLHDRYVLIFIIEQIVEAMTQSMWEFLHDRYFLISTFDLTSSNHNLIAKTFIH